MTQIVMICSTCHRIEVEPLVVTREFNMTFGEKYPVTTAVLSASQLEKLILSQVYFVVTKRPTHGQVRRRVISASYCHSFLKRHCATKATHHLLIRTLNCNFFQTSVYASAQISNFNIIHATKFMFMPQLFLITECHR
jgi:hypothetical protein